MATAFPTSTYPLRDTTRMGDDLVTMRDRLDDGNMRIRVLGTDVFHDISCVFSPMSEASKVTFQAYLQANRATEFTITLDSSSPTVTYQGYIWSDPRYAKDSGLYTVSFDFRGKVV
jgi:hypothetical protein